MYPHSLPLFLGLDEPRFNQLDRKVLLHSPKVKVPSLFAKLLPLLNTKKADSVVVVLLSFLETRPEYRAEQTRAK